MTAIDSPGERPESSRGAQLAALSVVFVPAAIPLWLVGSGRVDGADPVASLLAVGWVVWALVWISIPQRSRGLDWREIGLRRPPSWGKALLQALLIAVAAAVVGEAVKMLVVQPAIGAEADVSRFDAVRGDLGTLVKTVLVVWITSAFSEEVIWRGFLMTRLAELLGGARAAWITALLASSALFGLLHIYQGAAGIVLTGAVGLVFGVAFLWLRNVWPLVIAHGLLHVVSFTAMYLGAV
jgi:membrane protease YdiL (CAAX protease family)